MPERKESLVGCEQRLFNIFGETILDKWHLGSQCLRIRLPGSMDGNLSYDVLC